MADFTIWNDNDAESPRDWENLGTMVCFHGRYTLGDKHDYRSADYSGWDEMEAAIMRDHPGAVILPLFLYDHSGITMNTTGFSCPWDSGQVGFIFASREAIREAYGVKLVTKKIRARATESLRGEVETYDQYLTGEVYGFTMDYGNGETDSCGGFYGDNPMTNGMSEHIDKKYHHMLAR